VTAPQTTVASALEQIARHARRTVFFSAPLKTAHPFFQQPNPVRAMGEQIERLIEISELDWTFLRPGMFAGNALRWWESSIRAGDVVGWPYLAVPTARPTNVTWPQSPSACCVRTDTRERKMF
jgi:hypothetical protein